MLDQIRSFFAANGVIAQFLEGQVFFVLGVVMLLHWRQRSRLELAAGLPWLAAFGLLQALAVWLGLFIPMQERLAAPGLGAGLRLLQLFIYACVFAVLLGYGLQLIEPRTLRPAMVLLPLGVIVFYGALVLLAGLGSQSFEPARDNTLDAIMRYTVCVPAALLVAFGLRRRAGRLLGPLRQENIIRDLRVAGFGFVFYAVAEGVLVPPAPFFPANTLNELTLYAWLGIPISMVRAVVGAVILLFFFRALEVFRIEAARAQADLARQQSLNAERERISRDLHDGTLQTIYASGLVLDGARHSLDEARSAGGGPAALDPLDRARAQLDSAIDTLHATVEGIRTTIYDLRMTPQGEDLARGLIEILSEFRLRTGIQTEWRVEGEPRCPLAPDQQQHVYQIAREVLSNTARHSRADRVEVALSYEGSRDAEAAAGAPIRLTISDNGTGEIPSSGRVGRGLQNMRERARLLGAELNVIGTPGSGTTVTLEFG